MARKVQAPTKNKLSRTFSDTETETVKERLRSQEKASIFRMRTIRDRKAPHRRMD